MKKETDLEEVKNILKEFLHMPVEETELSPIITMARKTAANPDAYCLDLRVRLSVGCKRRSYFFLYLPDFSYFRL